MSRIRTIMVLAGCALAAPAWARAGDPDGPVAHWRLAGDAVDSSAGRFDARNRDGVAFTATGPGGAPAAAASFDGRGAQLEVEPDTRLCPGTGDFTLALWAHTDAAPGAGAGGDLVTLYDGRTPVGFNLSLRTNPRRHGHRERPPASVRHRRRRRTAVDRRGPLGAVFRYDGERAWTQTAQLDTTPDTKYRRAWTMAAFDGRRSAARCPPAGSTRWKPGRA